MFIKFVESPSRIDKDLQLVEMDTGINFIKSNARGFKTYGVSSCIVLVGYYKNNLLFMSHHSTPELHERPKKLELFIYGIFDRIKLSCQDYDLDLLSIYALGGQESSLNTVNAIRDYANKKLKFKLNIDNLHIAPHEDYFDLYLTKTNQVFGVYHPVFPIFQIEEELSKNPNHAAPLLFRLSVVASYSRPVLKANQDEVCDLCDDEKLQLRSKHKQTLPSKKIAIVR